MICGIQGQLITKQAPEVIIRCANGLSYEILVTMNTFYQLPAEGESVCLQTHFVCREDSQQLYGFSSPNEQRLFKLLIKANGVGPKLALSILSSISVEEFVQTVHAKDASRLVNIPGIGKKTAERLLIELTDRLNDWSGTEVIVRRRDRQDALSALLALGYKTQQANNALKAIEKNDQSTEDLIRDALRYLVDNQKRGAA